MEAEDYFRAIRSGDVERLKQCVARRPNLREATTSPDYAPEKQAGCTGLHVAVYVGKPEIAWVLLDAGIDIETRTEGGRTALHDSIEFGVPEITELLLDRSAELDTEKGASHDEIIEDAGGNALHAAAAMRYTKDSRRFIEMLLDCGADIDGRARDGRTALQIADAGARQQDECSPGHDGISGRRFAEVTALLLRRGARRD